MGVAGAAGGHRTGRNRGRIEMAPLQPQRAPMVPMIKPFRPEHAPSTDDLRQLASRRDFSVLTARCAPRTFGPAQVSYAFRRPVTGHRLVPSWQRMRQGAQDGGPARRGPARAERPDDERAGCPNAANPEYETVSLPFLGPLQQVGKTAFLRERYQRTGLNR